MPRTKRIVTPPRRRDRAGDHRRRRSSCCAAAPGELEFEEHLFGGASIDAHGTALTDEVLEACRGADAVLLGRRRRPEVGHDRPAQAAPRAGPARPAQGPRPLRQPAPGPRDRGADRRQPAAPARSSSGTDMLVVRELTGGIYFGEKTAHRGQRQRRLRLQRRGDRAHRAHRVRGRALEGRLASTRPTCSRRAASGARSCAASTPTEFPNVELEHLLVDNAAMTLVASPRHFDVLLTENMFGDILSDEAAMITGSIGMLPSASLGEPGGPGLFEPVHGSAPDIAGQGIANPLAMFLSAALMLRHAFGWESEAAAVESAVDRALARRPADPGSRRRRDDGGRHRGRSVPSVVGKDASTWNPAKSSG